MWCALFACAMPAAPRHAHAQVADSVRVRVRADSARAAAARADSARADAVIRLGEIRVHGGRAVATIGGASAIERDIDSLSVGAAPTLERVLRELPLLHVRTNSRGEAELLARGSESRQVAVLVDGVPLTLNWDGRADVSVIPATAPQELRYTRGLASMLHGPNVLGGVIETSIAGQRTLPARALQLTMGVDATGGSGSSATVTLPVESGDAQLLVRGGVGYRRTPGFPLPAGVVEPVIAKRGLRLNTDARSVDGFAAVRYNAASGAWLSGSFTGFDAERGVAAELDNARPRFWRYPHVRRTVGVVSGGTGFHATPFGGTGDLELSFGFDSGRTEILAYSDRSYSEVAGFENGDDRTLTLRMLADHTLGARGDLRAAYTLADALHDEMLPASTLRYRQRLWSAGAETVWRLAERAGPLRDVRGSVGGAYDGAATLAAGDKDALAPQRELGARAGLSALLGQSVALHAGLSRRGRFPSLREAYSGALDRFEPNPSLRAERLTAVEAGATARLGDASFQLVAFRNQLDNAIVRIATPSGRFQRINEDAVRTDGVEILASWVSGPLMLGGDLTAQAVRRITSIPDGGRPENQPELFGGTYARMVLPLDIAAEARASYTGRQYCLAPTGEDVTLQAGTRVGGELARLWRIRRNGGVLSRADTRITVDNIGDSAHYDQCGLPRPGRELRLQLRLF
jgi:iron complex outermembrane recepter protein